jgi:amino acid transporter
MRTLRLARVAAEAEALLLRRRLRRIAIRATLGGIAACFVAGTVTMLHVYAWTRLVPHWGPEMTALLLAGGDAVVAIVIALFALWTPSDSIAVSAVAVRDQAMTEMRNAFTVTSLLKPLTGILLEQWLARRSRKK